MTMKTDTKKSRLAGGFAAMFQPTARGDGFIDNGAKKRGAASMPAKVAKLRQKARAAVPAPAAQPAPIPPAPHDSAEAFGGKLVASFKWQDGMKASAARPADIPDDSPAPITYKGGTGRLPDLLPEGTRAAFLAHCEAAARESGATLRYINAKGGRARKHSRDGKRPCEIGIADGWQRYSVTIRKGHYMDLERMRAASGLSHKDIVDAALSRELARMRAEIEGTKKTKAK